MTVMESADDAVQSVRDQADDWFEMPTGEVLHSTSEAYRKFCEAWWVVVVLPTRGWTTFDYLGLVEKRRGKPGRDLLLAEIERISPWITDEQQQGGLF